MKFKIKPRKKEKRVTPSDYPYKFKVRIDDCGYFQLFRQTGLWFWVREALYLVDDLPPEFRLEYAFKTKDKIAIERRINYIVDEWVKFKNLNITEQCEFDIQLNSSNGKSAVSLTDPTANYPNW